MDRNGVNKSIYDKRIEEWREKRIEKLASRLQRNSNKPRTISACVLGIGYPKKLITLQPSQLQNGKGSRFNNRRDQRWNSGYPGHNSMHRQYPQNYRADLRDHGSFRNRQQKQAGLFSSQCSLYNNKKAPDKSSRRYSSCTNIDNTNVDETKTAHLLGQNTEDETDILFLESNSEVLGDSSQGYANSGMILENESLDANPDVDDSEIAVNKEPDCHSAHEDIEEEIIVETPNNDYSQAPVAIIVNGDTETEASKLEADEQDDIVKEIENIGNKLANISIFNEDTCEYGYTTPMKRERRQALLDSTNIIPSSIIKYAVREVRKNNEMGILLTPVRRSIRLSCTPVSRKNLCIQSLEDLSPEVRENAKFVMNTSINIPPYY